MLSGEKILVTGVAGNIAKPLSAYLAADNEVWGVARFSRPGGREEMEALGVHTHPSDLAEGRWQPVIQDEEAVARAGAVRRVLLCSGKVYVDLVSSDHRAAHPEVAAFGGKLALPAQTRVPEGVAPFLPYLAVRDAGEAVMNGVSEKWEAWEPPAAGASNRPAVAEARAVPPASGAEERPR